VGRGRRPVMWMAALLVLVAVTAAGAGAGVWWAFFSSPAVVPSSHQPLAGGSDSGRVPVAATQPGTVPPAGGVTITADKGGYRIRAPKYEAVVEADGCLTNLRVGGTEFLWVGGPISRGSYFFQGGALKLPTVEQPAANVVTAKGDKASVRYEFGPDALTWTVTNATDAPMPFFLVFDRGVKAVLGETGDWAKTPAVKDWQTTTWFAGKSRLKITGSNRLWGPFEDNHQVWHAELAPHETRKLVLEPGAASDDEVAKATAAAWEHRVQAAKYEAVVESDGCLTSLRVGGTELLWVGGQTSRGVYFLKEGIGTQKLKVEEASANVVTAKGERASIRYEFGPDTLTWTVTNLTKEPLAFFMVFGPSVAAVANDKGDWAKTPATKDWKTTTWFAGGARLAVSGGTRIWGPWEANTQVWDGALQPQETRQVVLKIGAPSEAEAAKVAALTGSKPAVDADLSLQSPLDYQVFQRYSRYRGQIALRGKVKPACDKVEVRLTGTSLEGALPGKWQAVPIDKANRTFDTTVPTPAGGWYKAEVRAMQGDRVAAETVVDHVGIGEVFVIAGQSNATNCGEEQLKPQSEMVATFDGSTWQPADDPQPGVHDKTGGGSCWPPFGDALVEKYKVPVGVVSVGHSGSSVKQWQPDGELFKWMMTRVKQLGSGGLRAVLWHQGESDVGLTADEYAKLLTGVIEGSKKEAGWDFPWFVAQASYHNPSQPSFPGVREGQKKLWESKVALEGPDTDTLIGDLRDNGGKGIHFSGKGQRVHGKLWADKVSAYLDRVLAE
jgi:eukaryotic-like serine/threonine-protein kinase